MKKNIDQILLISQSLNSFVKNDLDILKTISHTEIYIYQPQTNIIKFLNEQLKLFVHLLIYLKKTDLIYIWFADYHSLIPTILGCLFRKKVIVVIGGYEVEKIKRIKYGGQLKRIRRLFIKYTIKLANINLAVSKYTLKKIEEIDSRANKYLLYNGIKINTITDIDYSKKEDIVITVASAKTEQRVILKGLDTISLLAQNTPNIKFIIVGISNEATKYLPYKPNNLIIYDYIENEKLKDYYIISKVYCQLSLVESFGISVVEGMSYGCIPLVFDNGALSEVVGNNGVIIDKNIQISDISKKVVYLVENYTAQKKDFTDELDKFNIIKRKLNLNRLIHSIIE